MNAMYFRLSLHGMSIKPCIENTADGSATLRHPANGEAYHSLRGAAGESMHVFIRHGLEFAVESFRERLAAGYPLRVFEMGFGSGLNAWLTLDYACSHEIRIEYTTVELYPVEVSVAAMLGYTDDPLFMRLHTAPRDTAADVTECFRICKKEADFEDMELEGPVDLVFFDAFAPDVQPGLWTRERFAGLWHAMSPGGVLVTYSAKGAVKRNLRDAGFEVSRLPGALGKRHMLRAVKPKYADAGQ